MAPPRLNPGSSGFRTLTAAEISDLHDMWRMGVLRGVHVTADWTTYAEHHRGPVGHPPINGYVDQHGIHVYWPHGRIPRPGADVSTVPANDGAVAQWVRENFVHVEPGSRVDPVSLGESGSSALRPLDRRAEELVHRYPEVFEGHRIAADRGHYAEAWREHTSRLEERERLAPGTLGKEPVPPNGFMDLDGTFQLPPPVLPEPAVDALARTQPAVDRGDHARGVDPHARTDAAVDPLGPTQPGAQGSSAAVAHHSPIAETGPTGYRALTMEEALDVRAAFGQAGVRHGVASATAGFDEYRVNHMLSHPGEPLPMNGYVDPRGVHFFLLPDGRVAHPDAPPPPLRDTPAYRTWLQEHTTELPPHQLADLGRRHPEAIAAGVTIASDAAGYQRHYLENMVAGSISHGEADHLRALKTHDPDAHGARLRQLATEHHVALEAPPQGYWAGRALYLPPATDASHPTVGDHPQSGATLPGIAPPPAGVHPPQSGTTLTGVAPPAPPDHPRGGGGHEGFRPLTLDEARTVGTALDRGSPVTVHAVGVTSAVGDFATYRAAFEHAHPGHAVPMMGYRDANGVHILWTPGRVPDPDAPAPPLRDGSPATEAAYSEWLNRHTSEIPENHLAHAVARDPHLLPGAERLSDAGEYAFAYRRAEVLSFLHDDNPTMLRRLEKLERTDPERFHAEINARADRLHIGDPPASGFFGQNGKFTFLDPAATVAPIPDGLPAQPDPGAVGSARGAGAEPPSPSQHPAASTSGAAPTAEPAVSPRHGDTLRGIGPTTPHASADTTVGPHSGGSPDTHSPASGGRVLGAGIAAWRAISIADAIRSDPDHTAKIIGGEVAQEALDRVLSRVGVGNFSLVYSLANMIGQDSDHDRETLQHATREALREHAAEIAHHAAVQANLDVTGHPLPLWAEVTVRLDEIQGADSRLHGYAYAGSIVRYTSAMPTPTHGVQLEDNGELIQMNRPYLRLAMPLNDAARHELGEAEYQPDASDNVRDSVPPAPSSDAGVPHPAGQPPEPLHSDEPWIPAPDGPAEPPAPGSSGTAGAAKEQFVPDKDRDHPSGTGWRTVQMAPDPQARQHGAYYALASGNPYAMTPPTGDSTAGKRPEPEHEDGDGHTQGSKEPMHEHKDYEFGAGDHGSSDPAGHGHEDGDGHTQGSKEPMQEHKDYEFGAGDHGSDPAGHEHEHEGGDHRGDHGGDPAGHGHEDGDGHTQGSKEPMQEHKDYEFGAGDHGSDPAGHGHEDGGGHHTPGSKEPKHEHKDYEFGAGDHGGDHAGHGHGHGAGDHPDYGFGAGDPGRHDADHDDELPSGKQPAHFEKPDDHDHDHHSHERNPDLYEAMESGSGHADGV